MKLLDDQQARPPQKDDVLTVLDFHDACSPKIKAMGENQDIRDGDFKYGNEGLKDPGRQGC